MKGISIVEVFEREEKSVIFVCKMDSKGLTDIFYCCEEVGKTF